MALDTLPNGLRSGAQLNGVIETHPQKWFVQKFGGTSVGKFPRNIVDNVVRRVLSLICAIEEAGLTRKQT
jgi:hypothetical protein